MTDKEYKILQMRRVMAERCVLLYKWLQYKGMEYKEGGVFPLSLTDYYKNPKDIEAAAIIETLIPNPLGKAGTRNDYITEIHNLLGDSLSDVIADRRFLNVLPTKASDGLFSMFGVQKKDLFNMLDWIWEVREDKGIPLEYAFGVYAGVIKSSSANYTDIPDIRDRISYKLSPAAIRMSLIRLCAKDGIGKGVWNNITKNDIPCPVTPDVLKLVRSFYPIEKIGEADVDEVLSYFGFSPICDFVYTFYAIGDNVNGFREMSKRLKNVARSGIDMDTWKKSYKNGFLFLPENEDKLEAERERVRIARSKWRQARRMLRNKN